MPLLFVSPSFEATPHLYRPRRARVPEAYNPYHSYGHVFGDYDYDQHVPHHSHPFEAPFVGNPWHGFAPAQQYRHRHYYARQAEERRHRERAARQQLFEDLYSEMIDRERQELYEEELRREASQRARARAQAAARAQTQAEAEARAKAQAQAQAQAQFPSELEALFGMFGLNNLFEVCSPATPLPQSVTDLFVQQEQKTAPTCGYRRRGCGRRARPEAQAPAQPETKAQDNAQAQAQIPTEIKDLFEMLGLSALFEDKTKTTAPVAVEKPKAQGCACAHRCKPSESTTPAPAPAEAAPRKVHFEEKGKGKEKAHNPQAEAPVTFEFFVRPVSSPAPAAATQAPAQKTESTPLTRNPHVRRKPIDAYNALAAKHHAYRRSLETLAELRFEFNHLVDGAASPAPTTLKKGEKAYEERLIKILEKLDGVESEGDERVRLVRKHLASEISRELDEVDKAREGTSEKKEKSEVPVTVSIPISAPSPAPAYVETEATPAPAPEAQARSTVPIDFIIPTATSLAEVDVTTRAAETATGGYVIEPYETLPSESAPAPTAEDLTPQAVDTTSDAEDEEVAKVAAAPVADIPVVDAAPAPAPVAEEDAEEVNSVSSESDVEENEESPLIPTPAATAEVESEPEDAVMIDSDGELREDKFELL
jgi:hypothetical protein